MKQEKTPIEKAIENKISYFLFVTFSSAAASLATKQGKVRIYNKQAWPGSLLTALLSVTQYSILIIDNIIYVVNVSYS